MIWRNLGLVHDKLESHDEELCSFISTFCNCLSEKKRKKSEQQSNLPTCTREVFCTHVNCRNGACSSTHANSPHAKSEFVWWGPAVQPAADKRCWNCWATQFLHDLLGVEPFQGRRGPKPSCRDIVVARNTIPDQQSLAQQSHGKQLCTAKTTQMTCWTLLPFLF